MSQAVRSVRQRTGSASGSDARASRGAAAAASSSSAAAAAAVPAARAASGVAGARRSTAGGPAAPAAPAAAAANGNGDRDDNDDDAAASPSPAVAAAAGAAADPSAWNYPDLRLSLLSMARYNHTATPASSSSLAKFTQAELDSLVGEIMRLILARSSARLATPHKDLLALLGSRARGALNVLLDDARRRFMLLWGWELVELDRKEPLDLSAAAGAGAGSKRKAVDVAAVTSGGSKTYILRAPRELMAVHPSLARAYNFGLVDAAKEVGEGEGEGEEGSNDDSSSSAAGYSAAVQGLLLVILALLYTEERSHGARAGGGGADAASHAPPAGCTEMRLMKLLRLCDASIEPDQKDHPDFGNVWQLIESFVAQQYLDRVRMPVPSGAEDRELRAGEKYALRPGPRAHAEITTTEVYKAMCAHMLNTAPDVTHLKQIERDEQRKIDTAQRRATGGVAPRKPAAAAAPAASQA